MVPEVSRDKVMLLKRTGYNGPRFRKLLQSAEERQWGRQMFESMAAKHDIKSSIEWKVL